MNYASKDIHACKISNGRKANFTASCIAARNNRGAATTARITTVLNDLREQTGIGTIKKIDPEISEQYANSLLNRVDEEKINPGTAVEYISAYNVVCRDQGKPELCIKGSEWGFKKESVSIKDKSNNMEDEKNYRAALAEMGKADPWYQNLYYSRYLQTDIGDRARESYATKIADKALDSDKVHLGKEDCTKNSRDRDVPITKDSQRAILKEAQEWVKSQGQRSLIPNECSLKEWKNFANKTLVQYNKENCTSLNNHGNRHYYAHERYKELWQKKGYDIKCPAEKGMERPEWKEYAMQETGLDKKELDNLEKEIRLEVSENLGHSRIDITKTYLG